jgi:hypothetical protein
MSSLHFREEQRLKNTWIGLVLVILSGVSLWYGVFIQVVKKAPFGSEPLPDEVLIIFAIVVPLSLLLFYFMMRKSALITEVRDDSIVYRYPVFVNKPQVFLFRDIDNIYTRNYNAFKEFGGHGVKVKSKNLKSVTVSGNFGLQINTKSGLTVFIGTQKPEALNAAINKAKHRLR